MPSPPSEPLQWYEAIPFLHAAPPPPQPLWEAYPHISVLFLGLLLCAILLVCLRHASRWCDESGLSQQLMASVAATPEVLSTLLAPGLPRSDDATADRKQVESSSSEESEESEEESEEEEEDSSEEDQAPQKRV